MYARRGFLLLALITLHTLHLHADPLLINFSGTVVPAFLQLDPVAGIDARVGDAISGVFDLQGSTFQVNINGTQFVVDHPTVTRIQGDPVVGVTFSVWGDIEGTDNRMQLRFSGHVRNFGCVTCTVDLPGSSFLDYTWNPFALLWLRSNSSLSEGLGSPPVLPAGEFYPTAYPYQDSSGNRRPADFYLDGLINDVSPVPEPSTFVLLGSGVAVLLCWARRRRLN